MDAIRAHLDDAFPDDTEEIIERALHAYRPLLGHTATAFFRSNLSVHVLGHGRFSPWVATIRAGRPVAAVAAHDLTAAQVILLGGTRPTRCLHSVVAAELHVHLDGGFPEEIARARSVLGGSYGAVESLVRHHPCTPARGRAAALASLTELVHLGIAAQYASMIARLYDQGFDPERLPSDEEVAFLTRYFFWAMHAFRRLALTRGDQAAFRDYYVDRARPDELAEEHDLELDHEVERRRRFLKRLSKGLLVQAAAIGGEAHDDAAPPPPWLLSRPDPRPGPAPRGRLPPKKP
jgi:hypothetical protein